MGVGLPLIENNRDLTELYFTLGQMNAKLDSILQRSDEDRKAIGELAGRVSVLERWKWTIVGGAAASGGLVSFVTQMVTTGGG